MCSGVAASLPFSFYAKGVRPLHLSISPAGMFAVEFLKFKGQYRTVLTTGWYETLLDLLGLVMHKKPRNYGVYQM